MAEKSPTVSFWGWKNVRPPYEWLECLFTVGNSTVHPIFPFYIPFTSEAMEAKIPLSTGLRAFSIPVFFWGVRKKNRRARGAILSFWCDGGPEKKVISEDLPTLPTGKLDKPLWFSFRNNNQSLLYCCFIIQEPFPEKTYHCIRLLFWFWRLWTETVMKNKDWKP